MMDNAVMEYVKWFIGLTSMVFVLILVVFLFKLNEVSGFQQEVNYQIERNGGLTSDAMASLNQIAIDNYGGCLMKTKDDFGCLVGSSDKSSGFFVSEIVDIGGGKYAFYDRPDGVTARYGTPVKYVIVRSIGKIESLIMKPSVVGESASRIRGTSDN